MQWLIAFLFLTLLIGALTCFAGKQVSSTLIAAVGGIGLAIFLVTTRNFMLTFLLSVVGSLAFLLISPKKEL